jgi:hypothetical protein
MSRGLIVDGLVIRLCNSAAGMVEEGAAAWKSLPREAKGFDSLELPGRQDVAGSPSRMARSVPSVKS